MYQLKYVSQSKKEKTKKIKINNKIIDISFSDLLESFKSVLNLNSYNHYHKCSIDIEEIKQLGRIALWKVWKSENTDYSIYTLFVNNFKWVILDQLRKNNKHSKVISIHKKIKEDSEFTIEDSIIDEKTINNMSEERIILKKMIDKLSKREKNILLNKVFNGEIVPKDLKIRKRIINKLRIMYSHNYL